MTSDALVRSAGPTTGSDFAELRRRVDAAGLMRRRPGRYAVRAVLVGTAFVLGWCWLFAVGDSWWALLPAAMLALVFGQVALLAHDLAHRQVFRSRRPTEVAGLVVGNLLVGMSYGWWMDKHTRHHANPNHEELDPDVTPQILVWSRRQARASQGLTRWIGGRQAALYPALLLLEAFNLHVSAVRGVVRPGLRHRRAEAVLLGAHAVGYLSLVLSVLDPVRAVAFVLVNQCLFGFYLGSTFAPNHKGMPTLTGDVELDYLRKQVLTSRNVRGGRTLDLAMGGLNHQIEHHLFPSMPSANLCRARPIVRGYCAELGVPYAEAGLVESYRLALAHLHDAGAPIRDDAA
jgi:fatty acid desaturase